MVIGFTGTIVGVTSERLSHLRSRLARALDRGFDTVHHGDCVGADAQFHDIAAGLGFCVVIHPPANPKLRAHKIGDSMMPELGYIARNHNIVDAANVMIACPKNPAQEELRSGTWATVRYTRKQNKLVIFI